MTSRQSKDAWKVRERSLCHLPLEMALNPSSRAQVSCVLFPQLMVLTFLLLGRPTVPAHAA